MFYCSNGKCKEPISCTGVGRVDTFRWYDQYGDDHEEHQDNFDPKYFEPPLKLMDLPEKCPEEVSEHLESSFAMFFSNPAAAMNSARIALEALMDHFRVPRKDVNGERLSLHARVNKLPQQYAPLRKNFLAVKWLGNAGSHKGQKPESQDVVELYDIFEHALGKMFDEKDQKIAQLVVRINNDQGMQRRPAP